MTPATPPAQWPTVTEKWALAIHRRATACDADKRTADAFEAGYMAALANVAFDSDTFDYDAVENTAYQLAELQDK